MRANGAMNIALDLMDEGLSDGEVKAQLQSYVNNGEIRVGDIPSVTKVRAQWQKEGRTAKSRSATKPTAPAAKSKANGKGYKTQKGPSQATALASIAFERCDELFRTPEGAACADIRVNGHRETWPVRSTGFRHWLRGQYFEKTGSAANGEALGTALDLVEAHAQFGGIERSVHLRVAEHDGCYYVNLANKQWQTVEISPGHVRVVDEGPVRFIRRAGMLPLPTPVMGGSLRELESYLRMNEAGYALTKAWLTAAVRPSGPYPILTLTGEQGTAKTTTLKMLRSLVDPSVSLVRAPPKTVHDLYVMAINGWVIALDNLSYLSEDVADAMCRLSTGGGFSVRALYTNDEEALFDGQRPQGTTSIAEVATRPDLLDRTLGAQLEVIPETDRKLEVEVWNAFRAGMPRLLGGLYSAVAHGLERLPLVRPNRLPRMADFAQWSIACETAYQPPGTFLNAYDNFRDDAAGFVLEGDLLADTLREFMTSVTEPITTTTSTLYQMLSDRVPEQQRKDQRRWPQSAKGLGGKLRSIAPALRKVGLSVEQPREKDPETRRTQVILSHVPKSSG